ncbi:GNAT family N-acetyltransferase, partial [Hyalangium sp.]|uniref:GNAT family N-acetyltransferase n=1 Tax=Hyalangium sp. TaxID=2028555 RepID=UPI002D3F9DB2
SDDVRVFVELLCRWAQELPRTKYQLAMTLGGALIGTCGVRKDSPDREDAEWGCELDPAQWGQGYAHEASRAIIAFGFETLQLRRIWARTSPENARAVRLAEDLGLRRVSAGLYEALSVSTERG